MEDQCPSCGQHDSLCRCDILELAYHNGYADLIGRLMTCDETEFAKQTEETLERISEA